MNHDKIEKTLSFGRQVAWFVIAILIIFIGWLAVTSFVWYGVCEVTGAQFNATAPLGVSVGVLIVKGGNALAKAVE